MAKIEDYKGFEIIFLTDVEQFKIYSDLEDENKKFDKLSIAKKYIDNLIKSKEINDMRDICYNDSLLAGWHTNIITGELKERNKAEMICLIHSELSEAMEGERKNLMDDHLPNRPMAEVEMADAVIRIMDYCGRWGYDIGGAVMEKLEYNANRADHKIENRIKENGKAF